MEKKNKILIADDDQSIRELFSFTFSSEGFQVYDAVDGRGVIKLLKEDKIWVDLILLDVVMPEMDGFETLREIKKDEKLKKIPVISFTNLDNPDDRREALGMGADEYIVKSNYTPKEIVEMVRKKLNATEVQKVQKVV